jgi:hypothetical protein
MATNYVKFYKLTALPVTLEANAVYAISNAADATLFDFYMVDSAGSAVKSTVGKDYVDAAIVAANQGPLFAADITARNALTLTANRFVYVADATGDSTVSAGAALYFYNSATHTYIKVSEYESLDVVTTVNWATIVGKPTSSPTQIDGSVAFTSLLGEDSNSRLTYKSEVVGSYFATIAW